LFSGQQTPAVFTQFSGRRRRRVALAASLAVMLSGLVLLALAVIMPSSALAADWDVELTGTCATPLATYTVHITNNTGAEASVLVSVALDARDPASDAVSSQDMTFAAGESKDFTASGTAQPHTNATGYVIDQIIQLPIAQSTPMANVCSGGGPVLDPPTATLTADCVSDAAVYHLVLTNPNASPFDVTYELSLNPGGSGTPVPATIPASESLPQRDFDPVTAEHTGAKVIVKNTAGNVVVETPERANPCTGGGDPEISPPTATLTGQCQNTAAAYHLVLENPNAAALDVKYELVLDDGAPGSGTMITESIPASGELTHDFDPVSSSHDTAKVLVNDSAGTQIATSSAFTNPCSSNDPPAETTTETPPPTDNPPRPTRPHRRPPPGRTRVCWPRPAPPSGSPAAWPRCCSPTGARCSG
jgi:hypothetical protein